MQKKKQLKKICKFEFYRETEYILKDIITQYFGHYKLNLNYDNKDSKTKIIISRKDDMKLTICLSDELLMYEVILDNESKSFYYVKYDEINDESKWFKYERQLKEDFHNLIDYLCGFNYENKSIEYCDFKYSDDYVIENRRKYDCFNF